MNLEHVKVVKKGAAAIEEWRQKHPKQALDLSGADLDQLDLSKANLSRSNIFRAFFLETNLSWANLSKVKGTLANFIRADLTGADLSNARLFLANFTQANLSRSNFAKSNLTRADLLGANLTKANLSGAKLSGANVANAKFSETNFSNTDLKFSLIVFLKNADLTHAVMNGTMLVSCNLAKCVGLGTVKHEGPSSIDLTTLTETFREAGNRFTSDLETFLFNSGLPKDFLETLPKILAEVRYCSSFVCYGSPDLKFAKMLRKDLMARGASCWLYPLDAIPGQRTWQEITLRRREAEKMIVLCSAKALIRDGVLKEIEEQIDEDPNKMVPISLDDTWKEDGFLVRRGQRDLKPFLLERNYADFSEPSKYNESLLKLLKGLKRENN